MKNINSSFLTHLQSEDKKTICNCIKITSNLLDSDIYYFTDCFKDLIVNGDTYDADGSFTISDIKKGNGNSIDSLTLSNVVNPSGSDFLEKAKKKLLENAEVDIYLVNFNDPTQYYQDFKGFVHRVKVKNFTVDLEVEGLSSLLLQNIMKTYENTCPLIFGSDECGFDLLTVTVSSSVTSVTNRNTFKDTFITETDNFYRFGIITWTSGNNVGLSREIKSWDSINKEYVIYINMPYEIQVGDTYEVSQGCDKSPDFCKSLDNFDNFEGYLHLVPNADDLTYIPPDDIEEDS